MLPDQKSTRYTVKIKTLTLKIKEDFFKKYNSVTVSASAFKIADAIYEGLDDDQEHATVLFLDNQMRVTGYKIISSGSQSESIVSSKILFRNALLFGANSVILVHNHPGGELIPSNEDLAMTAKIKKAGKLLDITFVDHLIISHSNYYSFADHNQV